MPPYDWEQDGVFDDDGFMFDASQHDALLAWLGFGCDLADDAFDAMEDDYEDAIERAFAQYGSEYVSEYVSEQRDASPLLVPITTCTFRIGVCVFSVLMYDCDTMGGFAELVSMNGEPQHDLPVGTILHFDYIPL